MNPAETQDFQAPIVHLMPETRIMTKGFLEIGSFHTTEFGITSYVKAEAPKPFGGHYCIDLVL